ncbi:MAG: hypothetical protein MJB14_13700 [Spirochaetes bacterium]|nr:hypothetical protein [Spirochaetota bacterium]
MKRYYCLVLFTLVISCHQVQFFDLDGPQLVFCQYWQDSVFLQFNEPIKYLKIETDESQQVIQPDFPKTNFVLNKNWLNHKSKDWLLTMIDTSDNVTQLSTPYPKSNSDPAKLIIDKLSLRYSKKQNQFITLKCIKSGDISDYQFVFFIKGKEQKLSFQERYLKKDETILIELGKKEISHESSRFFSKPLSFFVNNNRLSQNYSLIYIIDHQEKLLDYLLYYHSDYKGVYDILEKPWIRDQLDFFYQHQVRVKLIDIKGMGIHKPLVRHKNDTFYIKTTTP